MQLIVSDNNILYTLRGEPRFQDNGTNSYLVWTLVPVAIYDYVDPDYSDKQGWLQEIPHTGEIDLEEIVQYVYIESLTSILGEYGYEFKDVNTVYVWDRDTERPVPDTAEAAVENALDMW